jgi:probable phosphoglycerate mutase
VRRGAPRGGLGVVEFLLIRHGVTAWNRERRFQGQTDIPLDEEGHRQARRLAAALSASGATAVYASDLARAWHTARPVAEVLGLPLLAEPGLRERHYGSFEGRTFDELERDWAAEFARWRAREPDFALPGGGESLLALQARVGEALETLARRHPGERVVAVTHGGVLDCAYRIATGLGIAEPRRHDLLNASINRIARDENGFRLIAWGDIAHLDGGDGDAVARG